MQDKTPDGEEFDNPFLFDEKTIKRVSDNWFSAPSENYSEEFKEGFIYAFKTGFKGHAEIKKCPHKRPSCEADAWWSGYGQACTWLFVKAQDNDQYWNWRVYSSLRTMAPKLNFKMPSKMPRELANSET